MPALTLFTEWRGLRTGEDAYRLLAHRWAKAMGVLFAVGAVSGTILSFEMGLLWPGMMSRYGQVIGLPFALEGIAFFIEAIFLGIYLYAWDRLPPRQHLLSGIPIVVAGVCSAFFVVTANAWMNQPRGFDLTNGTVTAVDPWAAMFNPATQRLCRGLAAGPPGPLSPARFPGPVHRRRSSRQFRSPSVTTQPGSWRPTSPPSSPRSRASTTPAHTFH